MNATLPEIGHLVEVAYFPLLFLNVVAMVMIYAARRHRWAKRLLQVFLVLNTPVVLFLIVAIAREAHAIRGKQGTENGMVLGLTIGFSLPILLEFLMLLSAWSRLRQCTQFPQPNEKG